MGPPGGGPGGSQNGTRFAPPPGGIWDPFLRLRHAFGPLAMATGRGHGRGPRPWLVWIIHWAMVCRRSEQESPVVPPLSKSRALHKGPALCFFTTSTPPEDQSPEIDLCRSGKKGVGGRGISLKILTTNGWFTGLRGGDGRVSLPGNHQPSTLFCGHVHPLGARRGPRSAGSIIQQIDPRASQLARRMQGECMI